jgi:hypothetical protein
MAAPVSTIDYLAYVDHYGVELHDPDCDAYDPDLFKQAHAQTAASNGYQIRVNTAQESAQVRVLVELWKSPPAVDTAWPQRRELELLCPTGRLIISEGGYGVSPDIALPSGPGIYRVRACYDPQQRSDTAATSQRIFREEDDMDMIRQRHVDLAGHEAYRFQVWFDRPDDEDED